MPQVSRSLARDKPSNALLLPLQYKSFLSLSSYLIWEYADDSVVRIITKAAAVNVCNRIQFILFGRCGGKCSATMHPWMTAAGWEWRWRGREICAIPANRFFAIAVLFAPCAQHQSAQSRIPVSLTHRPS